MLKTTGTFNEENKERKERGIVASVGREETLGNQTTRDSRASERGAWRLCLPATLVCPSLPGWKLFSPKNWNGDAALGSVIGRDGSISTVGDERTLSESREKRALLYPSWIQSLRARWNYERRWVAFFFPLILCYLSALSLSLVLSLTNLLLRDMLDRRFRINNLFSFKRVLFLFASYFADL